VAGGVRRRGQGGQHPPDPPPVAYPGSGNVYDGSFVRDALEGHGITHRVDGGSYEGEFVDGDRQGYGQFTGKDGDGQFVYQGNYVGNKRHGPVRSLRLPLPAPLRSCPSCPP